MAGLEETIDANTWVDEYADALYNYAIVRVNDHELAHDLVQDTFMSGLRALDKFEGKSSVKTWLYSILKRKIIDHWRQRDARKTRPISAYFQEDGKKGHWLEEAMPQGSFKDIEADIENQELGVAIQHCIDRLPEKWKGVVIDRLVEEKETDEVCKEYDITTSNLWVIIHRAKLQLRDCLEKTWIKL